ncbi:hypothetical protein BH23GEM9_BH23GEM9_35200 [soil metagenome]
MTRIIALLAFAVLLSGAATSPMSAQTMDGTEASAAVAEAVATAESSSTPSLMVDDVASAGAAAGLARSPQRAGGGPERILPPAAYRFDLAPALQPASHSGAVAHVVVQRDRRRGLTWVLVGVAMIAAGMVIDGDAGAFVSVGGAVIGGYGVYLMVRD